MARLDYDQVADRYHAGRGVPLDHLDGWRSAIGPHVVDGAGAAPLLDLGAGTGIWTVAFRQWFEAPVVAVEPSHGMRQVARDNGSPDRAWLVAGRAEAIPLDSSTVGTVWMSTVVHHVEDLGECAHELARVLRADGRVLIPQFLPRAPRRDHAVSLLPRGQASGRVLPHRRGPAPALCPSLLRAA